MLRMRGKKKGSETCSKVPSKRKEKPKYSYLGLECDSLEEKMFLYWVEELIIRGYISKVERTKSYLLTDGIYNTYSFVVQMKTKSKGVSKTQCILEPSSYTPDFHIYWTPLGLEKFCWKIGDNSSFNKLFANDLMFPINNYTTIEVKGTFNADNMIRVFQNNKKFLYSRYKIFANLVIPDNLFKETFIPAKARFTPTGKPRKINYKTRTLNEYIKL